MKKEKPLRRKVSIYRHNFSKATRIRIKRKLVDMMGGKCVDCGFSAHLAALDFDHIEPSKKKYQMAQAMRYLPWDELLVEAQKCVLRCANCHRIKTHPNATV